jgi:ribosomal protein S18 acetylase RimI-like enzyme
MEPIEAFFARDYRPEDYLGVEELWRLTEMGSARRGDSPQVIDATLAHGGRLLVLVGERTGMMAGTSWLTSDARRLYLHHFAIHPSLQGHGLARRLLAASLRVARETGLQVKLEVHRDNERAIRLYRRAGFAPLGDYDVYIIRDLKEIVMPEKT